MDLTLDRITYIAAKFLCPVVPSHIDISCYLNQNVSRILLELTSFVYLYININLIEGTSLCFVICDHKGWAARCLCPSHRASPKASSDANFHRLFRNRNDILIKTIELLEFGNDVLHIGTLAYSDVQHAATSST